MSVIAFVLITNSVRMWTASHSILHHRQSGLSKWIKAIYTAG